MDMSISDYDDGRRKIYETEEMTGQCYPSVSPSYSSDHLKSTNHSHVSHFHWLLGYYSRQERKYYNIARYGSYAK